MDFINKNHPSIIKLSRETTVRFTNEGVYFSKAVATQFNLIPGKYIHFVNNKNEWLFLCNEDHTGFKILSDLGKEKIAEKSGVRILSSALAALFKKETRFKDLPKKFYVSDDPEKEFQGTPLGVINIHKAIGEIGN